MSFVPQFFQMFEDHLRQKDRLRTLKSLAVMAAPEHWLSLEAAALLDINREKFGLAEPYDNRANVPRWLVAAERRKVDLWIEDLKSEKPSTSIEFKVIHNNKNIYQKIWEIRKDIIKPIPYPEHTSKVERWGVALLICSNFYKDQSGNYSKSRKLNTEAGLLKAFTDGITDTHDWYADAPQLELALPPARLGELTENNYIDPAEGSSGMYLALVRHKEA